MSDVALAFDLGGTKLEAALVAPDGTVIAGSRNRHATGPAIDAEGLRRALIEVAAKAIAALPEGSTIRGAGIGAAGPIDREHGAVHPVNLPGVRGFPLVDAARAAAAAAGHDIPVVLGHDGGSLALAEAWVGATVGAKASLSIVVSTGVGGGFVIGGRPLGGASGNAGHIGQTRSAASNELTLEEVASGPASVAWARAQGWSGEKGEDLGRDAAAGDATARSAIERSAAEVGKALAEASTLLDLEVVAIGGGFSRVSPDYVELVGAALRQAAVLPYVGRTRVVRSGLGDEGPLIGAAALVVGPGA